VTEMLKSVKADLLDRRLLPIVALVLVALLAAIGYAVLGGGSSSAPTASASGPAPTGARGIAITEVQPSAGQAIAETTDGVKTQRRGSAHDPFAALAVAVKASAAATSKASASPSSSSSKSSGTSSSASNSETTSPSSSSSKPSATPTPSTPSKPKTIYSVALEFGPVPAGAAPESALLKPYAAITKATPLPSRKERLIEFVGVTVTHASVSAAFAVDGEVILHGSAACLPSPTQCQVIDVKEGGDEQLEAITAAGTQVVYELRVVSIASTKASSASLRSAQHAQAMLGSGPLSNGTALQAAGLRFSGEAGVLVFAAHPAPGAHAAAARHRGR